MDPYLEQYWRDIHHRLLTYASDQLQPVLPGDLRARLEERVWVEPISGDDRAIYPDIRVIERGRRPDGAQSERAAVGFADPLVLRLEDEPASEGFIEVIDIGSGKRVVTVIELLSLSNKWPGDGQNQYTQKQRELRDAGVSLVEIDLLRAGKRVLAVPPRRIPDSHRTAYQVCVHRGWRPKEYEVYRAPLREPLPTIKVPLRETDADAPLDLQKLVELAYTNGGYDDIDYKVEPQPPLDPDDAAWADELLKGQGLR
jgi:hypothetical protein